MLREKNVSNGEIMSENAERNKSKYAERNMLLSQHAEKNSVSTCWKKKCHKSAERNPSMTFSLQSLICIF